MISRISAAQLKRLVFESDIGKSPVLGRETWACTRAGLYSCEQFCDSDIVHTFIADECRI